MSGQTARIIALAEMQDGQDADVFVLLAAKEEQRTRDGKPYQRVTFRDARREVTFPIWNDSPWAETCRTEWAPGCYYKLRGCYRETSYGPQLEIRRIREVVAGDERDGFDPATFLPHSEHDPSLLFAELRAIAELEVVHEKLRQLTLHLLDAHRAALLLLPGAQRNHHAYVGGWLEHTLAVTQTCVFLADRYQALYPELSPPLDRDLVVAGAILHDIGKLAELEWQPAGAAPTAAGSLLGHLVQGRDMVREAAAALQLSDDVRLRLEHILIAHQGTAEFGAARPPMTAEALLIHYADDFDAKFNMLYTIYRDDRSTGHLTSSRNVLGRAFYRGPISAE